MIKGETEIEKGDVVQLTAEAGNFRYTGCFLIVESVKDWGITGWIFVGRWIEHYVQWDEFEKIGHAAYQPMEEPRYDL
jgi:hypothetical protein